MKIHRQFAVLLLLVVLFISHRVFAGELFGTIWYKGVPLQNAEVTVKDKTIKTNSKGYYSVTLDAGSYTLGIKLPTGAVTEKKVDVFPQDTEKNLKLE